MLRVWTGRAWTEVWSSARAPQRWTGALPAVAAAVRWVPVRPGLETGELRVAGTGEAWRVGVVLARMEPRRFRWTLQRLTRENGLGGWTVDSAGPAAALAVNAGQFDGGTPWGWVVSDGREVQTPGSGPLSAAVTVDTAGAVRLVPADEIAAARARGGISLAFQNYPAILLGEGTVPPQLMAAGRGVDVEHRDARLALCELRDGRILFALTRFEGLGGVLQELPFGPTTPEMAGLMGALGCRRAVLLDGGISSQLLVRRANGAVDAWRGMRRVPLGLVLIPRDPAARTGR